MIIGDFVFPGPSQTRRSTFDWRAELDGRRFNMKMEWTERGGFWTLDLRDASQVDLQIGTRMVSHIDLIAPFSHLSDWPPGQIFIEDAEGEFREPGRFSFLSSHKLIYRPESVVAEAAGTIAEVV